MTPELRRVGREQNPVLIFDNFTGAADGIAALADALAPFPAVTDTYYPGVRRMIEQQDREAFAYVIESCRKAAPYIAETFSIGRASLVSASFSIVSLKPSELSVPQRGPHFDTTDPTYVALLHYLRLPAPTGTAFYRQRATGIERVTTANVDRFIRAAQHDSESYSQDAEYIQGSNAFFEETAAIDAVVDRMIAYQGSVLHSGIIPVTMPLSNDPRVGRLTANFFIIGN